MRYDIFNRKAPAMPKPSKGQKHVDFSSHRPQNTCKNRLFRWQFLLLPPI